MADETPAREQDKFVLRLPDGMRDRIKAAADANNRSMNSEIISTLEEKYPEYDQIKILLGKINAMTKTIKIDRSEESLKEYIKLINKLLDSIKSDPGSLDK